MDNLVSLTEHCVRDIAVVMEDVKILMHQPNSDDTPTSKPRNCQDVKNAGQETNGLATIFLPSQSMDTTDPLTVFCDQTTADGGWLVLLRRIDNTETFLIDDGWITREDSVTQQLHPSGSASKTCTN